MLHLIKRLLRSAGTRRIRPEPSSVSNFFSRIDPDALAALRDRYRHVDPYPGFSKYLDAERWIQVAISHARWTGCLKSKTRRILDIGSGAGYFPFVCNCLGHTAEALDVAENEFYREMISLLGVRRTEHRIEALQPLPASLGQFDLITAFAVCFNGHATPQLWGPEPWSFLIDNLARDHARPGAQLFLKLNPEPDGTWWTPALRDFFLSRGGQVDNDKIRLPLR
jgi:SAM-dependent methyltransferase